MSADADEDLDIVFLRTLGEETAVKASDPARERIQDRIKRLETFQEMASAIASDLRTQLEQT